MSYHNSFKELSSEHIAKYYAAPVNCRVSCHRNSPYSRDMVDIHSHLTKIYGVVVFIDNARLQTI